MSMLSFFYGFGFLMLVFIIGWYVLQVIAYWRIFTKAGEAGWKSLIPFYKTFIQYRITWDTTFFWIWLICSLGAVLCPTDSTFGAIMGFLFSLVYFIISVMAAYRLSTAFGHGVPFALGIFFFEPIFIMILGLGSSRYLGPQNNSGNDRYIEG